MKKSLVVASLLAVFAMSGFAQSAYPATPAETGAKLVAERDAEWNRAHSGGTQVKEPMAMHHEHHHQHVQHAKDGMHVKHAKHGKHHGKHHGKKDMMQHDAAPMAQ